MDPASLTRRALLAGGVGLGLGAARASPQALVGLRPYRPGGAVVSRERLGKTLVVHHYGHGGAGFSLAGGLAPEVERLLGPDRPGRVTVVGAGVVGATTAYWLAERGWSVSWWSAGSPIIEAAAAVVGEVWHHAPDRPPPSDQGVRQARAQAWLTRCAADPTSGVQWKLAWSLHDQPTRPPAGARSSPQVAARLGVPWVLEQRLGTIDPAQHLGWLRSRLARRGVAPLTRRVERAELADLGGAIVNCAGLGAGLLAADPTLRPVRGQALAFTEPLAQAIVRDARSGQEGLWVPRGQGGWFGATAQPGRDDLQASDADTERLRRQHQALREKLEQLGPGYEVGLARLGGG